MKFGFYNNNNDKEKQFNISKKNNISCTVKFKLEERSGESSKIYIIGKTSYLTEKGIYIKTDKTLPPDAIVDLRIIIPPKYQIVLAKGIVIWCADQNLQPDDFPGMGIKFNYLKESDRKKIKRLFEI